MRAKRCTEQEQYEIIMECRQSELSDHQWCLEHDINPRTFYNWVRRFHMQVCGNGGPSRKRPVSDNPSRSCKNGDHSRLVNRSLWTT